MIIISLESVVCSIFLLFALKNYSSFTRFWSDTQSEPLQKSVENQKETKKRNRKTPLMTLAEGYQVS